MRIRHLYTGAMFWAIAAAAVAQQTDPASEDSGDKAEQATELEEITVSGEKQGRTLEETTSSVRVFDEFELEEFGDDSVEDTLERTGGAVSTERGQFSLRGINSAGVSAFDLEDEFARPLAAIRVDGVVLDRIGSQFGLTDLFDVSQVEVLRGPQPTTQGRSALAGTIVVNTRKPTRFWELRGETKGLLNEDFDGGRRQFGLAGGGPLGENTAFRFAAQRRADDGDIVNVTRGDDDWTDSDSNLGRLKLAHDFTDIAGGPKALVTLLYSDNEEGPSLHFKPDDEPAGSRRRTADADFDSFSEADFALGSLQLNWAIGPRLELTTITGALRSRRDAQRDFDFTAVPAGRLFFDGESTNLTQEVRLNFNDIEFFGMRVSGLAGAFGGLFDDQQEIQRRDERAELENQLPDPGGQLPPPLDELLPPTAELPVIADSFVEFDSDGRTERNAENVAAFGNVDFAVTDALTITLGLRYDRETAEAAFPFQVNNAELVVPVGGEELRLPAEQVLQSGGFIPEAEDFFVDTTFDAWLPKAAVRYEFTPNFSAFASFQRAYRAGGAEILMDGTLNEFDPEFTNNYETGFRLSAFDDRFNARLNAFYVDWTDQQVRQLTDNQESFRNNAGSSSLLGADIELEWRPMPTFNAFLSAGVVETEFEEFTFGDEDFSGNEFVRAPTFSGSMGAVWRPGGGLFVSTSLSHTTEYFLRIQNDPEATSDPFTLLDTRIGYETAGWAVFLTGRNLLNDDFATARFLVDDDSGRDTTGQLVGYGELRQVGLEFEFFF